MHRLHFTAPLSLNTARFEHTATLPPNGMVLVAEGMTAVAILPRARNCTTRRARKFKTVQTQKDKIVEKIPLKL
jgi:hypothetical protein